MYEVDCINPGSGKNREDISPKNDRQVGRERGKYNECPRNAVLYLFFLFHKTNNGISLSSLLEQKYSPNTTIIIIPRMCMIHQSHVEGNPP
mmetsp:Transcript_22626/g.42638  ORF Transcript_22626/g.42638 Transcript_22626/m.42638 type:complete len:91 (-) Transcript_22626:365-637(-)